MDVLTRRFVRVKALLLAIGASACVPDLDSDESTVSELRVLAIQADPAEAKADTTVTYRALLVDQKGERKRGSLAWFYCNAPKPLAELGPINQACLRGDSGQLTKIGTGPSAKGTMPVDACSLFGPNPPPPVGDEPAGRPVDPDQTGGYKVPVMLGLETGNGPDVLLYEQRVACGLAGVNPQLSVEFAQRYKYNANPQIDAVRATRANGDEITLAEDDVLDVKAGEEITLAARWPSCPESDECGDGICGPDETAVDCAEDCGTPVGCSGQERYLWFDTQSRKLTVRREGMRLAWYATAGEYADQRTGVSEEQPKRSSSNVWTAPAKSGLVSLWVVLRDARGGVGFRGLRARVK